MGAEASAAGARSQPRAQASQPQAEASPGDARAEREALDAHGIVRVRASNPGPMTLSGTNTWVVGRDPAWVIDPGPLLDEHLGRLLDAVDARGGLGGVVLTHDHADHSEALRALLDARPAPLAAGRGEVDVRLEDGESVGPFEAVSAPGHAPDHFALIAGGACFTGDAVLGEGSVFISPYPGAMSGYLAALERLRSRDEIDLLCPGHGPPVWDPEAKLGEYIAHRLERENGLIAALGEGARTVAELLDGAWSDVPEPLRPLATVTLAAHLDRLEEQHALPAGVERPAFEGVAW
jgi:glyoxylase-like metal-dependent hydrolase (beta-lactamase superfamily II)